jgi:hypothetical protein
MRRHPPDLERDVLEGVRQMPTKSFWEWQASAHLCAECCDELKDCMRCEIVWDAALLEGERRAMEKNNLKKPGVPAKTAGTGAASPSHSLPAERQERPPSGRDAHQSQLDTVTPTCADCAVHPSYCKNCTDMSGFVTFKEPA